jgi:hypothetical protein
MDKSRRTKLFNFIKLNTNKNLKIIEITKSHILLQLNSLMHNNR